MRLSPYGAFGRTIAQPTRSDGLKTPDARLFGLEEGTVVPSIRPRLSAFEAWLETRS